MDILNVYKILKYIALIIIIYFSLRMVNRKLENIDTIIIALVIATGCAILENLYNMFGKKSPSCKGESCSYPYPKLEKEPFDNSSSDSSMNSQSMSSSVESQDTAVSSIESQDTAVASIVATAESKPVKIIIQSENGQSSTYTQTGSGTYVKTSAPTSSSTASAPTTASTARTVSAPSTSSTASSASTASTASTASSSSVVSATSTSTDTDYISTIDIAGVTGENVMDYASGNDFNRLPVSTLEYDYGYSFMPPKDWFPIPPNPPVCMSEKKCPVCPIYTGGTSIDLKEWNKSLKVA